jgi:hypothetical protein
MKNEGRQMYNPNISGNQNPLGSSALVRFLGDSEYLDRLVLRQLSHINANWELTWDDECSSYRAEEGSFAAKLNAVIGELSDVEPARNYHDYEDVMAEETKFRSKWNIRKENGRWVGADYPSILEQGSMNNLFRTELLRIAAGRISLGVKFGQTRFDEMEDGHRTMLADILAIILYHRTDE